MSRRRQLNLPEESTEQNTPEPNTPLNLQVSPVHSSRSCPSIPSFRGLDDCAEPEPQQSSLRNFRDDQEPIESWYGDLKRAAKKGYNAAKHGARDLSDSRKHRAALAKCEKTYQKGVKERKKPFSVLKKERTACEKAETDRNRGAEDYKDERRTIDALKTKALRSAKVLKKEAQKLKRLIEDLLLHDVGFKDPNLVESLGNFLNDFSGGDESKNPFIKGVKTSAKAKFGRAFRKLEATREGTSGLRGRRNALNELPGV